uniref:nucleolin 2-like n=1 Tax=Styela clava TaxID=7725 RepID=UPI0019394E6B|nr:nucleolin 2-like [Styela clava]
MDIGAAISKKIQMAITAKLKELNAYVDDELPDYIMIMVANKKTESQMTEALSLFLSNNTKIFTSWLHNLLATLRKSRVDKKAVETEEQNTTTQSTPVKVEEDIDFKVAEENSIGLELNMKKELNATEQKDIEPTEPEITINAESDIIFEVEEDLQMMPEIKVEKNVSDDSLLKSPPPTSSKSHLEVGKSSDKRNTLPAPEKRKSNTESKETITRHQKDSEKSNHKSSVSRKRKSDDFQPRTSHRKSPVSRRHREERNVEKRERRSSNTNTRTLESDSKKYTSSSHDSAVKKNTGKSRVRDWDRGKGQDSDGEITSVWDGQKSRNREQWVESDGDDEISTAKLKGTISSAVNAVFQDEEFVSESESDDEHGKSSANLTSKVAYPERKMRVPLAKQANKALLMKAVTEAERSIRRKNVQTTDEPDETELHKKTRRNDRYIDRHLKSPNEIWVEKSNKIQRRNKGTVPRQKSLILKRVLDKPMYQDREEKDHISRNQKVILVRKNVAEARKRQTQKNKAVEITRQKKTVRTKHPKVILLEDEEEQPVTVIHVRRKSQDKRMEKVIYVEGSSSEEDVGKSTTTKNMQIFMRDRRTFVARDVSPIHTTSAKQKSPAVKFDSRQATRNSDNSEVEIANDRNLKRTQKATAKVSPRLQQSARFQTDTPTSKLANAIMSTPNNHSTTSQERAQNPRFIVTLDGVAAPKQTKLNKVEETKQTTKSFKFQPVTAPVTSVDKILSSDANISAKNQIPIPVQKPIVIDAVDTEDDNEDNLSHSTSTEIGKMRKKLLKVQEEAAKLKQMQARLAAAQAQQSTVLRSSQMYSDKLEAERRSIYIGNVHFSTSEKQLSDYFSICGKINRVTILKDSFTGHPKGFAYLEFDDKRSVSSALALDNTSLNKRVIRVTLKQSKPANAFLTTRGQISSRNLYQPRGGRRLYRGSRFQQTTRFSFPPTTSVPLPSRNKTWVNPAIASSSK